MFKIVETVGSSRKQLTIVPFDWEKDGQLFWPKTRADQLVLVANSKPDTSWFTIPCKLRGNLYADFPIARDEIEKLLEEHEAARLQLDQTSDNQSEERSATVELKPELMDSIKEVTNPNPDEKREQSNEKLDQILANQQLIIENQSNFHNVILQRLAKFEEIFDAKSTETEEPQQQTTIQPIDTYEDLVMVEEKLSDTNTTNEYIEKFSHICGKSGDGNGSDNCYLLVDRFFTRKFMTLCSWAGGARDKREKIPFKIYKNVINVFFRIVQLSDKDFTLEHCEAFFKGVIRNSTRRNESHRIRTSRSKRRPKNLSYRVKEGRGESDEHDVNVEELDFFKDEHEDCSEEEGIPEKQSKYQ